VLKALYFNLLYILPLTNSCACAGGGAERELARVKGFIF
jgi:hypothetical protein